jgi:hypothetical protein
MGAAGSLIFFSIRLGWWQLNVVDATFYGKNQIDLKRLCSKTS